MTELTLERWEALHAGLEDELAAARERLDACAAKGGRYLLMLAGVATGALAFGLALRPDLTQVVWFSPFAALAAVCVFLYLRALRRVEFARHEVERIERDIRAWKKKKPGSIFDRRGAGK